MKIILHAFLQQKFFLFAFHIQIYKELSFCLC